MNIKNMNLKAHAKVPTEEIQNGAMMGLSVVES
jgi:hypothetical protein